MPEARRAVAVDGHVGSESVVLLVADHVREFGLRGAAPRRSFGVQVASAAESALSRVNWYWVRLMVLSSVRSWTGCMYRVMPASPAVSVCSRRITSVTLATALGARLQIDQKPAAVQGDVVAVDADERGQALHVRIREDGRRQRLLPVCHGGVRDRLGRLRHALYQAGVLVRKEALRNEHVQERRDRQRGDRDPKRRALAIEHPRQARGHTIRSAR